MDIIIVGAGEIGRHLATHLSAESHNIVVIENSERLARELDDDIDARVICADGSSVSVLLDAGAPTCALFLAVTADNNTNLVSSSIAKSMGATKVICRIHPDILRDEWLFDLRAHFGIDHLFSSERLAAVELSKRIRNPDSLLVQELARGRIELQEVSVAEGSDADGVTLAALRLPSRVRIAAIRRGKEPLVPNAETVLSAGDVLTVFGEPRKLRDLAKILGARIGPDKSTRVVIFGGNAYGLYLAQTLEGARSCKVRIFEESPERCEELVRLLPNTTVIQADATRINVLREEAVGDADFFVASSDSDEDNVMSCLQAKKLGTESCLTLIHRADYADTISGSGEQFGIKEAVSPRDATLKELLRFVTSDRYHKVMDLDAGEVIEALVPEGSRMAGQKVSEIDWPAGSMLVAHLQNIHASVPAADDVINAGDHIFAMVAGSAKRKFLKLLK